MTYNYWHIFTYTPTYNHDQVLVKWIPSSPQSLTWRLQWLVGQGHFSPAVGAWRQTIAEKRRIILWNIWQCRLGLPKISGRLPSWKLWICSQCIPLGPFRAWCPPPFQVPGKNLVSRRSSYWALCGKKGLCSGCNSNEYGSKKYTSKLEWVNTKDCQFRGSTSSRSYFAPGFQRKSFPSLSRLSST